VSERVDFYFDYLSPYAYFASLRVPEVCARHGARVVWRPILFAALLDHHGHRGPAEIPAKALYTFRDCARWARSHDVPFRAPRHHPFRPLAALRLSLAEVAGPDQAAVIATLFRFGWGEGGDLGDPGALSEALRRAGLPADALRERAGTDEAKAALRANTEGALARGVFGIPTMIARGELIWGNDRMDVLEAILEGRDPLAGIDLRPLAGMGPSAVRPRSRPAGR
jgi:2-hydroxychromene-2-carboxylate isomerase